MKRVGYFALILLLLADMASAIGVVYARHESRRHFVVLANLERERDEMNFEFGRLQLEQSTWGRTQPYRTDRAQPARHDFAGAGRDDRDQTLKGIRTRTLPMYGRNARRPRRSPLWRVA